MKEISVQELTKINDDNTFIWQCNDNDDNIFIWQCNDSGNYYIELKDKKIKNPHYTDVHKLVLSKSYSNLESVNKILAIFDYKIVKPLIDFSKPLDEELRRLADENKQDIDWIDFESYKHSIAFDNMHNEFRMVMPTYNKVIGVTYFDSPMAIEIKKYLNHNKDQAIKAMEL